MIITEENINADFRSAEVTALRNEADIVVTNPPFSMFTDFIKWINPDENRFLILGTMNAIAYNSVWHHIFSGNCWLGARHINTDMYLDVPDDYKAILVNTKQEGSSYVIQDNIVRAKLRNCCWFTNMEHRSRHEYLTLLPKSINEAGGVKYVKYDNYDAIEVPAVRFLPSDYDGVMGVPISFLGKYNPEQFEIVGIFKGTAGDGFVLGTDTELDSGKMCVGPVIAKKAVYVRILIQNK